MKAYFKIPITSKAQAHQFLMNLHQDGLLFHPEDRPETILKDAGPDMLFTAREAHMLTKRMAEVYLFDNDPCAFCVEITK